VSDDAPANTHWRYRNEYPLFCGITETMSQKSGNGRVHPDTKRETLVLISMRFRPGTLVMNEWHASLLAVVLLTYSFSSAGRYLGCKTPASVFPRHGKFLPKAQSARFLGRRHHTHLSSPTSVRLQYPSGTIRAASCGVEIDLCFCRAYPLTGWLCKMNQCRSPPN
jgi:hypothetical protein